MPRSRDESTTTATTGAVAAVVEAQAAHPRVDAVLVRNASVVLVVLHDVDAEDTKTPHPGVNAVREGLLRRLRRRLGRALCGALCAHKVRRATTLS